MSDVNENAAAGWRAALGRVGVWAFAGAMEENPRGFAGEVEQLGYSALWVGGGNPDEPAFDRLDHGLGATSSLVLATGIASIWAWEPAALARRSAALEAAYPGRFVLGLGVSHAPLVESLGRRYERPLQAMVDFLDQLALTKEAGSLPPIVLAALAQKMLELSGDRTAGAHPYLTPPEHTAVARRVLGAGPLLAPEQALVLEEDPEKARVTARTYLERYLRLPNYRGNLERLGYSEEDLAGEGSDRLVDTLVVHGSAEAVAEKVAAHFTAGADHVCIQPLAPGGGIDTGALEALAPLLLNR